MQIPSSTASSHPQPKSDYHPFCIVFKRLLVFLCQMVPNSTSITWSKVTLQGAVVIIQGWIRHKWHRVLWSNSFKFSPSKHSEEQKAAVRSIIYLAYPLSLTSGSHKPLTFPPKKRLFLNLRMKKAMKKVPSMRMRERRAVLGCILIPSDIASAESMLAFRLLCTFGG